MILAAIVGMAAVAPVAEPGAAVEAPAHLVISELVTAGHGASDEFIEVHNPSATSLPLEGLELVYATASGLTVSRRAAWELGAPSIPPGGHLLVANEQGIYAPVADALYSSGIAATGGSVALRIVGASTALDAVGWGTAASSWMEGSAAPAPSAGSSLERLPGGALGSTVDSDDNAADFTLRTLPEPQNAGSPPTPDPSAPPATPGATPTVSPPSAEPTPSPGASATPVATPHADPVVSIADARTLADGATATVDAVALTGSDFHDGGGYVADDSAGIAVIVDGATFARGERLRITGTVDDRFSQRTLRADAAGVAHVGAAGEPVAVERATGQIDETVEGRLVSISGVVTGAPTELSAGLAYEIDDGSGPIRLIVGMATGIDSTGWTSGTTVTVVGVVGQRDSSGSGASGYRVQPRDANDVLVIGAPSPTPDPTGSPDVSASPSPGATPDAGPVVSIVEARAASKNARLVVSGVVTLPPGVVDAASAVIQDATGAILLRLGDETGALARGTRIRIAGTRSTKSGMESLRVTAPPLASEPAAEPTAIPIRTGDQHEPREARLVVATGALTAAARRASSGTVSFEIDDGSGPLRVVLGSGLGAATDGLKAGTWVEVRGVLGQETTGALPSRGYRIWPREIAELRIVAGPAEPGPGGADASGGDADGGAARSLDAVGAPGLGDLRVGATLVSRPWPELGLGGLLWDGTHLVGLTGSAAPRVGRAVRDHGVPVALELQGLSQAGTSPELGLPLVSFGDTAEVHAGREAPAPPSATLPADGAAPTWVSLVGRLVGRGDELALVVADARLPIDRRCAEPLERRTGTVRVTGIGLGDPARLVVGCEGVRPAPALVRITTEVKPASHGDPAARPAETVPSNGRRAAAAALLGAGALLVVVGALLRRRWVTARPPAATEPELASDPPRLTLVPVQREHGSR